MDIRLIYVSVGDVSVYESQVVELLNYLQNQGIAVTLLQGYKNDGEKLTLERKLSNHPAIPTVWVKSSSVYPFTEKNKIKDFYRALSSIEGYRNAVIHVRNEFMGYIMKQLLSHYHLDIPMLIDVRGVIYEELKYKQRQLSGYRKLLSVIQRNYLKQCYQTLFSPDKKNIAITSVSPMINDYIQKEYPANCYPLYVHQNIAGTQFSYDKEQRKSVRNKYHISDDDLLAICSTAGNAVWQKDHLVIKRLLDLGVKVINLSKNDIGIEGCITTTVPFTEMPALLSAGDLAVLWRDDTFMNNSASPSKFSEFAAMGLYVIHNNSVKVAVDHIVSSGAGCLVKEIADIQDLPSSADMHANRERWCKLGLATFGVDGLGQSYINKYIGLKNRSNG